MKRFITILTAIIVLAIISCAFSFKMVSGAAYCASTTQNDGCAVVNGKTECANGTTGTKYYKYNAWDGNASNCLSTRCNTQTTFYNISWRS